MIKLRWYPCDGLTFPPKVCSIFYGWLGGLLDPQTIIEETIIDQTIIERMMIAPSLSKTVLKVYFRKSGNPELLSK
jgi:hypothetical protein